MLSSFSVNTAGSRGAPQNPGNSTNHSSPEVFSGMIGPNTAVYNAFDVNFDFDEDAGLLSGAPFASPTGDNNMPYPDADPTKTGACQRPHPGLPYDSAMTRSTHGSRTMTAASRNYVDGHSAGAASSATPQNAHFRIPNRGGSNNNSDSNNNSNSGGSNEFTFPSKGASLFDPNTVSPLGSNMVCVKAASALSPSPLSSSNNENNAISPSARSGGTSESGSGSGNATGNPDRPPHGPQHRCSFSGTGTNTSGNSHAASETATTTTTTKSDGTTGGGSRNRNFFERIACLPEDNFNVLTPDKRVMLSIPARYIISTNGSRNYLKKNRGTPCTADEMNTNSHGNTIPITSGNDNDGGGRPHASGGSRSRAAGAQPKEKKMFFSFCLCKAFSVVGGHCHHGNECDFIHCMPDKLPHVVSTDSGIIIDAIIGRKQRSDSASRGTSKDTAAGGDNDGARTRAVSSVLGHADSISTFQVHWSTPIATLADAPYARLPTGRLVYIKKESGKPNVQAIPSELIYKTIGGVEAVSDGGRHGRQNGQASHPGDARTPLRICKHYEREKCARGPLCHFIHPVALSDGSRHCKNGSEKQSNFTTFLRRQEEQQAQLQAQFQRSQQQVIDSRLAALPPQNCNMDHSNNGNHASAGYGGVGGGGGGMDYTLLPQRRSPAAVMGTRNGSQPTPLPAPAWAVPFPSHGGNSNYPNQQQRQPQQPTTTEQQLLSLIAQLTASNNNNSSMNSSNAGPLMVMQKQDGSFQLVSGNGGGVGF